MQNDHLKDYISIEKQPTINIGTIGHVAHGKSTTIRAISGRSTLKHKSELERNITIKLGYANAKIFECNCERPQKYSTHETKCLKCKSDKKLIRHISFVDCPGHEVLMATMLNGTAVMDSAFLLIAASEPCPQPQTTEHLFAVSVMGLTNIVVLQNKIDLISKEQSYDQYEEIKNFLTTSRVEAPIIPISGQLKVNIDAVLDLIVNYIKEPVRNLKESPKMIIIRSFDINKPGTHYKDVVGGVIGGSVITGYLKIGDEIEIRPGFITKLSNSVICRPYISKVISLFSDRTKLDFAVPGGLIGVGTELDPYFCKADGLIGNTMGIKGHLPPVYYKIQIQFELFETSKADDHVIEPLAKDDSLLFHISSNSTGVKIININNSLIKDKSTGEFELFTPCCTQIGERLAISRKQKNKWRLIGHGTVSSGETAEIVYE